MHCWFVVKASLSKQLTKKAKSSGYKMLRNMTKISWIERQTNEAVGEQKDVDGNNSEKELFKTFWTQIMTL